MVTRVIRPGTRIDIGTTGPVIVADPRTEAPAVAAPPPPQELPDDRLAGAGLSGDMPALLLPLCGQVEELGRVRNPIGVDEERDVPITLCRALRVPLPELWARVGPRWG